MDIIKILIKFNADIEIEVNIFLNSHFNQNIFVQRFNFKDKDGDRAIHHAAFGNEPKVIEMLASINQIMNSKLPRPNKSSCLSTSVSNSSSISNLNLTPKIHQIELNSRNKKMQTALHIAVNKGHVEVVKTLLKLGAHVSLQDTDGDTPLHDAITKKNDSIINLLLDFNADLSICNNFGFNSIHHAALRGNTSSMRCILNKINKQEKYWLIDERKEDGFSALHLACLNNYYDVVKMLIENGNLNINIKNANQQTPLHLSIERLNFDISKLLVEYKHSDTTNNCNINAQDKDGDTPLHCLLRNFTISQLKQIKDLNVSSNNVSYKYINFSVIYRK